MTPLVTSSYESTHGKFMVASWIPSAQPVSLCLSSDFGRPISSRPGWLIRPPDFTLQNKPRGFLLLLAITVGCNVDTPWLVSRALMKPRPPSHHPCRTVSALFLHSRKVTPYSLEIPSMLPADFWVTSYGNTVRWKLDRKLNISSIIRNISQNENERKLVWDGQVQIKRSCFQHGS